MSARKDYPYPQDEFDVAGAAGGPEGVHRAERSTARKLAPWIVVLLVVPLISFGIVYYLSQNDTELGDNLFGDDEPPAPTQPTDGEDADGSEADGGDEEGTDEDGGAEDGADQDASGDEDGAADEGEEEPEPEAPPVNREVAVRVLNATGISGLAGIGAERVQADGFASVVADNYTGGGTRPQSVVKYSQEDLKPTAEQVAQVLGIGDVVEDPEAGDGIIVELWEGLN
ncbi:MAG TPA: LytR C-terminal domain-containing protein [Actinomycetales bacterium]|nr:LytR C-terminal domain-containing protein [Actinomycetales bacterium]